MVNLKQINRATEEDMTSGLKDWAKLFKATTWEELLMIANNNESMKSFTFSLKELTNDEKIQMQCEARERYEHDKASFIRQGYDEGVAIGVQQGIQQELQRTRQAQERAEDAEAELRRLKSGLNKS